VCAENSTLLEELLTEELRFLAKPINGEDYRNSALRLGFEIENEFEAICWKI